MTRRRAFILAAALVVGLVLDLVAMIPAPVMWTAERLGM